MLYTALFLTTSMQVSRETEVGVSCVFLLADDDACVQYGCYSATTLFRTAADAYL